MSVLAAGRMKLGMGGRFAKLKGELARKGTEDPGALAAWIGRKNLGKARFQGLAAAGRRRHAQARAGAGKK